MIKQRFKGSGPGVGHLYAGLGFTSSALPFVLFKLLVLFCLGWVLLNNVFISKRMSKHMCIV